MGEIWGVLLDASPGGVITSLNVRDNSNRGIMLTNGSDNGRVEGNVSADNGASAIAVVSSDGAVVSRNRSLRNAGGSGVRLEAATHTTITHNTLNSNGSGVDLGDGSNDNQVSNNSLIDDHEAAVAVGFSDRNVVTHNYIIRSGSGVILESADNTTITDNQILHSVGPDGIGIQIYGNNNLVARNTVIDSIRYGIEVDDFQDEGHSPVNGTVLRDNVVEGGAEGIAIGPEAGGVVLNTLIEHNVVSGALDDGIQLIGPSTGLETSTITRNVAVHNGDLGIETVPGTIDGGGNHAAGNGNPLQCLNITCH
jgi:parallel beta-helix repeat protein